MIINIIDLIVGGALVFYFVKNVGGLLKTAKTILVVFLIIIFFGLAVRLIMVLPFTGPAHKSIESSYTYQFSNYLIRLVYPAVEKNAPKANQFIKDKIMTEPANKIETAPGQLDANAALEEAKKVLK